MEQRRILRELRIMHMNTMVMDDIEFASKIHPGLKYWGYQGVSSIFTIGVLRVIHKTWGVELRSASFRVNMSQNSQVIRGTKATFILGQA